MVLMPRLHAIWGAYKNSPAYYCRSNVLEKHSGSRKWRREVKIHHRCLREHIHELAGKYAGIMNAAERANLTPPTGDGKKNIFFQICNRQ